MGPCFRRDDEEIVIPRWPNKKRRIWRRPCSLISASSRASPGRQPLGRLSSGLFLHRSGIEALGIDVAVDEFDHGHRRVVAVAEAGLDDAGIAALPVLVAGGENIEQFPGLVEIADLADRLPAHGQTALLAERDQLFHDRAQ